MDVALVIKLRLGELGLDQGDLATAAQVTDSYVSQLLTRKKAPPDPSRTDIYDRIGQFLNLPPEELSQIAAAQRREELMKRVAQPPGPLFKECRELVLRKCSRATRLEIGKIFAREPFGELERLVTQRLLDVSQTVAREELRSEEWLRLLAQLSSLSYEQMRVAILEFLDIDVFSVSIDNCVTFLDLIIESWDIELKTFSLEVVLNRRLAPGVVKRFEFVERQNVAPEEPEPGFEEFLRDRRLSGDATQEEIELLRALRFRGKRPVALYYYRELQSIRDPLHFSRIS